MSNENVSAAFGLKPAGQISQNLVMIDCVIPASDSTRVGKWDPVKLASTGAAVTIGDRAMPTVARCAAGDPIFGVVVSVGEPHIASDIYRVASTLTLVKVCLALPGTIFEIQEDSVGGALALTNGGNVGDIVVADCSTTTGKSAVMLDSSTVTTGGSAQLLVLAPAAYSANGTNVVGDYCVWLVVVNEGHLLGSFAGV